MEIAQNTVVGITFELKVSKDEEGIESAPFSVEVRDQEDPFFFLFGNSGLPEKFEEALKSKKVGDRFQFGLNVDEAYGQMANDLIMTLPVSQFSSQRGFEPEMLVEGNFLPLTDENGLPMQAKILEINEKEILLDFNHPLVGFDLHFEGEIFDIRNATEEEILSGLVQE